MKSKKILFFGLIILTLIFCGFFGYSYIPKTIDKSVIIKCRYMAYACGDCYPQYRVDEVINSLSEKTKETILKQDISVFYEKKELENSIDKQTSKCVICFNFYFTGVLKHSKSKGYFLDVSDAKAELKPNCCAE
jgi:hypothetical protein